MNGYNNGYNNNYEKHHLDDDAFGPKGGSIVSAFDVFRELPLALLRSFPLCFDVSFAFPPCVCIADNVLAQPKQNHNTSHRHQAVENGQ